MRDLLSSIKRGPKAVYISVADFPKRHPWAISGFAGGMVIFLLIFAPGVFLYQRHQISVQKHEITKIGALCGPGALHRGSEAELLCTSRTRIALEVCRAEPQCNAALVAISIPGREPPRGVILGGGSNPSGRPGGQEPPSEAPSGGGGSGGGGSGGEGQGGGSGPPGGGPVGAPGPIGVPGPQGPTGVQGPPAETPIKSTIENTAKSVDETVNGTVGVVCSVLERLHGNCQP